MVVGRGFRRHRGRQVKEAFGLPDVRIFGDPGKRVKRAAILPGSGKSVIPEALGQQAQVLITGDMGHHEGLDAVDAGMALIDAGHYGLERVFTGFMADFIEKNGYGEVVLVRGADFPAQAVIDRDYAEGGYLSYRSRTLNEGREPLF